MNLALQNVLLSLDSDSRYKQATANASGIEAIRVNLTPRGTHLVIEAWALHVCKFTKSKYDLVPVQVTAGTIERHGSPCMMRSRALGAAPDVEVVAATGGKALHLAGIRRG